MKGMTRLSGLGGVEKIDSGMLNEISAKPNRKWQRKKKERKPRTRMICLPFHLYFISEMEMSQWVIGHGSNVSLFLDRSHGSLPLTH